MSSNPTEFRSDKHNYRVLERLGGGQTAEVYRVRPDDDSRECALKLLTAPQLRTRFLAEVEILRFLNSSANRALLEVDGRNLVPDVYDVQETGEQQFIVMTLATGERLDELLLHEGKLPERDTLLIAERVARVFQALHMGLHRSYLDFQPRNVYWEEGLRRVLVLDFNLLSSEGRADVAGDIHTFGALLFYRMAVGVPVPPVDIGDPEGWGTLTPGTQSILRRLVQAGPDQRYPDMESVRTEIESQLALWETDSNTLTQQLVRVVGDIQALTPQKTEPRPLTQHEIERRRALALDAANILAIIKGRGQELDIVQANFLNKNEKLDKLVDETDAVNLLLTFIGAQDWPAAREQVERALPLAVTYTERLRLNRWKAVVDATGDEATRKVLVDACRALDVKNYAQVEQTLSTDVQQSSSQARLLARDARAHVELGLARTVAQRASDAKAFGEAAEHYRKAAMELNMLPYADVLRKRWGNPTQLAEELEQRAQELRSQLTAASTLELTLLANLDGAGALLAERLSEQPGDPALIELGTRLADTWLAQGEDPAAAKGVLEAMLPYARRDVRALLSARWQVATAAAGISAQLARLEPDVGALRRAFTVLTGQADVPYAGTLRDRLLAQVRRTAEQGDNLALARGMADWMREARLDGQGEMAAAVDAIEDRTRQLKCDNRSHFMEKVHHALSDWSVAELEQARDLVRMYKQTDGTFSVPAEELDDLDQQLSVALAKAQKQVESEEIERNFKADLVALQRRADSSDLAMVREAAGELAARADAAAQSGFVDTSRDYRMAAQKAEERVSRLERLEADLAEVDDLLRLQGELGGKGAPRDAQLAVLHQASDRLPALSQELQWNEHYATTCGNLQAALEPFGALAVMQEEKPKPDGSKRQPGGLWRDIAGGLAGALLGAALLFVLIWLLLVELDRRDEAATVRQANVAATLQASLATLNAQAAVLPTLAAEQRLAGDALLPVVQTAQADQLEPLVQDVGALKGTTGQLMGAVATLQVDVQQVVTGMIAGRPDESAPILPPTADVTAIRTALIAGVRATVEAEVEVTRVELAQEARDLDQQWADLRATAEALNAAATAVAGAVPRPTPTATSSVAFGFPADSAVLPIMPWSVVVSTTSALTDTLQLGLVTPTGGEVILGELVRDDVTGTARYTRAIPENFDEGWVDIFPNLDAASLETLNLDAGGRLPAGNYELIVYRANDGDSTQVKVASQRLVIGTPAAPVEALVVRAEGLARYTSPAQDFFVSGTGGVRGSTVRILGRAQVVDADGERTSVFLFEADEAGPLALRRGWTPEAISVEQYFAVTAGTLATLPDLTPPE